MGKFAKYQQKSDRKESTARYTFYELEGEPFLDVVLADSSNTGYINALLRRNRSRAAMRNRRVTKSTIERQRDEDRKLFARHVVKGWGKVLDDETGKPIELTVEECEEFLFAIPYWAFDTMRDFASDPQSFLEDAEEDGEEMGKD